MDSRDPAEAVEQCCRALELKAGHYPSARLLASLLQTYALNGDIEVSARAFVAALAFPGIDRQALCVAAFVHLKSLPLFARVLALGGAEGWDAAARFLVAASGRNLLRNKLLGAALSLGVNTDVEVEFLLTAFRRYLLLFAPAALLRKRRVYEFACALIQQCINNEFIFAADDDEYRALDRLEIDPGGFAGGAKQDAGDFLLLALYKPMREFIPASLDLARLDRLSPRALRDMARDTLAIQRAHAERARKIECLTEISDETSKRVERQYIADPYPKWLSLQTPAPGGAQSMLRDYFTASELQRLDSPFHVLIAGCGTGQQAVDAALGYGPAASVLAVDLSAPSLAYGERMAAAFGTANLRFAQADILGLGGTGRHYDIIECVGVLHHMAEPYAAWRILVDRLRPGGLMMIGLYSGISRGGIMALRDDPACPGPGADDDALRDFRAALMHRQPDEPGAELTISQDFFYQEQFPRSRPACERTALPYPRDRGIPRRPWIAVPRLPPAAIDACILRRRLSRGRSAGNARTLVGLREEPAAQFRRHVCILVPENSDLN